MSDQVDRGDRDEQRLAELGYKQELTRVVELVLELRDLVHDHLGAGGVLHHLRPGLEQRRPGRHLLGLADHLRPDPGHRPLHGGARLGLSHGRRPVLVGGQARRSGLVLVHRLVQRDRPGRGRRVGRLRRGDVRFRAVQPLGPRPRHHQLRRRRVARRDLRRLRRDHRAARGDQHLLVAPRRAVQQHLGVRARVRRGGHHRDPRLRARPAPELRLRVHGHDQQLGLRRRDAVVLRAAARLPADDVHRDRL